MGFISSATRMARWIATTLIFAAATGVAGSAIASEVRNVALFVNGTLGDKSFFDSAARGLNTAQSELGIEARTVEVGFDPTRWESGLVDVAESGDYDVIVALTFDMAAVIQRLADDYPEIQFIILDASVDYSACKCANVYSAVFRQNEGGYLAGVLAASLLKGNVAGLSNQNSLGAIGAMNIPPIADFIIGYEAGAKSILPDVAVLSQFANSFSDPAMGKEIALAEFGQGAGIVFQVAGGTGQGVIEAAAEAGKLVIGVDSDQALMYQDSNPQVAQHIVSSVIKNIDVVVLRSLQLATKGELKSGKAEALGLAEGGIALADNEITRALVPTDILDAIHSAAQGIADGSIIVPSAM